MPTVPPMVTTPTASIASRADLWIALGLAVVTVALYWPVHRYDFVNYDDVDYVRRNAPVLAGLTLDSLAWAFTTLYAGFWIPLTWLSLMIDAQLYGTSAGGFHVTNLLLHVISTVFLFVLLARATGRRWPSAFVAALFALHPLHVESVAWVTERKDVLSTVFLMLTLWVYGRYVARPTGARYLVTLVVFTLGLMAKPMLMTLPLLLLLLDLWPLRRFSGLPPGRLVLEKLPFVGLSVASGLVTMLAGNHITTTAPFAGVPIAARLGNACQSYLLYLAQTVWPSDLAALYPDPGPPALWRAGLAALALIVVSALALREAGRRPWLTAGWFWYALALVPVSGLVKIGPFVMADRFTYVPLLGIFVVVAWGVSELVGDARRPLLAAAAAMVLLAAFAVARVQVGYWRDSITLFERTLAVTRDNPVGQYLLGLAYAEAGRRDEAVVRYREALRLDPTNAHVHTSLGVLLANEGKPDDAVAHYTEALRADPEDAYAHSNLATALMAEGRIAEAIEHYERALRADPNLAETHNSYGKALGVQGRMREATAQYEEALRLKPDDADAHNNLGNALADQGRAAEAMEQYTAALRLRPDFPGAHVNAALFLAQQGRYKEAAEHYRAALRLKPDDAHGHGDLGNILAADNKLDEAVVEYQEALRLDPTYASAQNNLANALVMLGRVDEGIERYTEALRLDPSYADAHYNFGVTLVNQGRTKEAIEHFAAVVRLTPDSANAHAQLGSALRATGKTDDAIAQLTEALRLDPNHGLAQQELALARAGKK